MERVIFLNIFEYIWWPSHASIYYSVNKLNQEKIVQRHLLKSKKNWNCKMLYTCPNSPVELLLCAAANSSITLSNVYSSGTSEEVILQSCFLDVLQGHTNIYLLQIFASGFLSHAQNVSSIAIQLYHVLALQFHVPKT